jgi:hypothetical protein
VESPCLSILVPLLVKGLREKAAVVRKTAVIIDNMVKVRRMIPLHALLCLNVPSMHSARPTV